MSAGPPPLKEDVEGRRGGGTVSRRRHISLPSIARRGRTTLRQFVLLLLGGYIAWVEASRRRSGGRSLIFRFQASGAWFCRLFVDEEMAALPFPTQLRRRLEELGPTYVKLGQVLSLRADLLPESVTGELRNLLASLPELPFEIIAGLIEADLQRSLESMFSEVDPKPLGSASIAQTHRAATLSGEQVILKVVKPGIRDLLIRDAALLKFFGRILQHIIPRYQPRLLAEEFCEYTLREVEMLREAENTETFIENFKDIPEVVFPKVYREFTGENVLCQEYLEGIRPDRDAAAQLSGEERQSLIDIGASAIIRMLYEDGFFHADLHPGNLLVLPGPKIGFIDFGMVGRLEPDLRHHLLFTYFGMVMGDFENASRHLSEVALIQERSDVPGFRRAMRELCRRWRRAAHFEEMSLAMLMLRSLQLGARYNLYFPVEMVLMVKALVTYEGVGYLMDSEFDVAEVSKRHVLRIFRSQFSPTRLFQQAVRSAPDLADGLTRLPLLVSEGLRILEMQTRRPPQKPLAGLRGTIFGASALVSGAILVAYGGPWYLWGPMMLIGILVPLRRER